MTILDYTLPTDGLAGCFIDGQWHRPTSGKKLPIENPSRRDVICEIGRGDADEIDLAVAAAEKARRGWAALSGAERGRMLTELSDRLSIHVEEFARLLAAETGNAIKTQARGEANGAAAVLKHYGGVAVEQKGETLPLGPGLFSYTTREPIGVVGAIIPWNAPLQLGAVKIGMALGTGNCLVLKPAEDAPLAIPAPCRAGRGHLPTRRLQRGHRYRRGGGCCACQTSGHRQDVVHGIIGGGQADRPCSSRSDRQRHP